MTDNRTRNALIGRVHQLAKMLQLGDRDYRAMLLCHTGKQSCKDLCLPELTRFIKTLEKMLDRIDPDTNTPQSFIISLGVPPEVRPTPRQWEMLGGLSRKMGWSGLADPRFLAFVARTTTSDVLEGLTRRQVSHCITGLRAWHEQIKAKAEKTA